MWPCRWNLPAPTAKQPGQKPCATLNSSAFRGRRTATRPSFRAVCGQRAALLRTYLFGKSVALLDEPFSALDTITKSAIHRWYLDVMEQIHLSTLFITHDIDEAILLSDRIYILSGRPGHITDEIHINVPKPRAGDFTLTPEFLAYKRQIIEAMHLS